MSRVYFHGDRAEATAVAERLVRLLTGQEHDQSGIVRGVFLAVGVAALSDIKADFVRKARGGTGEDGVTWAPLSRAYVAYQRRFGAREKSQLKKAAGLSGTNRLAPGGHKGLLTEAQLKRWRKLYSSFLARFLSSMPEGAAKGRAAATAWVILKREGAKTMLEVFGARKVEILRDTGILLNSLSPGELSGGPRDASYAKPDGEGGQQQILDALANGVVVGTNVPYASAHQRGVPAKGLPARPFLPAPGRVPELWRQRWARVANKAIAVAAEYLFSQGA